MRKMYGGLCALGFGVFALVMGCAVGEEGAAGSFTIGGDGGGGSCVDGMQNGSESDVDCGGAACGPCAMGQACSLDTDCMSDLSCDVTSGICTATSCNDGVQNGDEADVDCGGIECAGCPEGTPCSEGTDCDSGMCTNGACAPGYCGDGTVNAGEACDAGGQPSTECNPDCTLTSCGDGEVNMSGGEDCDDGMETATCDADCTAVACGDGTHNTAAGEICDEGGSTANCDGDCTLPECGDGFLNPSAGEDCEDGGVETQYCDSDCTVPVCGDGNHNATAGEACDDGGESAACDADCSLAECGDGQINATAGETCDDGGESSTCDSDCTAPMCGDGVVNAAAGEECDDGGNVGGDGCDMNCQTEFPPVCTMGTAGVISGSNWVVCEASPSGAWLSHGVQGTGGTYDPLVACQSIGYGSVGSFGGNCGDVCGYCSSSTTSCSNPGPKNFTGGGTSCGTGLLCYTVMWECLP